jgi:hypothetical protein
MALEALVRGDAIVVARNYESWWRNEGPRRALRRKPEQRDRVCMRAMCGANRSAQSGMISRSL